MSQNDLLKTLEEDVRGQTRSILEEAEESARNIVHEAELEVEKLKEKRLKALKRDIDNSRAAAVNRAHIKARAQMVALKTEVIEEVITRTIARLSEMDRKKTSALVRRLYEELKGDWPMNEKHDRPVVYVNPADVRSIKDSDLELKATEEVSLGVVFATPDGRVRMDNTLHSRLKRARKALIPVLNKTLFSE